MSLNEPYIDMLPESRTERTTLEPLTIVNRKKQHLITLPSNTMPLRDPEGQGQSQGHFYRLVVTSSPCERDKIFITRSRKHASMSPKLCVLWIFLTGRIYCTKSLWVPYLPAIPTALKEAWLRLWLRPWPWACLWLWLWLRLWPRLTLWLRLRPWLPTTSPSHCQPQYLVKITSDWLKPQLKDSDWVWCRDSWRDLGTRLLGVVILF